MTFTEIFKDLLLKSNTDISRKIHDSVNSDIDISMDYIDISMDRDDLIKFIPKDKLKSARFTSDINTPRLTGHDTLIKELGFELDNIIGNDNDVRDLLSNEFKLIECKGSTRHPSHLFYLVEFDKGERTVLYSERAIRILNPTRESKYQDIKIGRFARAFLNALEYKFSEKELETFVNNFISCIKIHRNRVNEIEIVEGDDIKNWYNYKTYQNTKGQLGSSCMRYKEAQDFLTMYSKNTNKCKMAILKEDGQLIGRALIWTLDNGKLYMDRQYTNQDNIVDVFKEYANRKEMLYFNGYTAGEFDREPSVYLKGSKVDNNISVTLDTIDFDIYPYCDTFRFMVDNKISSLSEKGEYYDLINTNGTRIKRLRDERGVSNVYERRIEAN